MLKDDSFRTAFTTFVAMKNKLHIVGLRYYAWSTRIAEIFAPDASQNDTRMGQKLFLQRDYQCVGDKHAVMAWSQTEPVGHVCFPDLPLIAGVLEQGDRDLVVVRIVGLDALRRALVVEPVEDLPELPCERRKPAPWTWGGPVLPLPMIWAQADHFGRMMNLLVDGELPWNEEIVNLYMQYTVTDLSGDAYSKRSLLAQTLLGSPTPIHVETGRKLLAVMDHMGSKEQQSAWYNRIVTTLINSPEAQKLASRCAEVDMHQVLTALRSFPSEIGCEWLAGNSELFVHRLYYAQIPRMDILKLFSLIILYTSACRLMQSMPAQPAIGLSVGGPCQMDVNQLTNKGTLLSIEQARILPQT